MTRTRTLRLLGGLALAVWLAAPAPAQGRKVAFEGANNEAAEWRSEVSTLRAELSELRSQMHGNAAGGYEGDCGCGAPDCCDCCCEQPCGTWGGFEPCCHSSGIWAEAEALFFRYHRADGVDQVRDDRPDLPAEFDFDISPRITVGYVRDDGLGVRARYWQYDHESSVSGVRVGPPGNEGAASAYFIHVDTYNIDVEVFNTIAWSRDIDVELSAGVRWNEFFEQYLPETATNFFNDFNSFSAFGGMMALEVRQKIGASGILFARARYCVLMDDHRVGFGPAAAQTFTVTDVVHSQTELALGYQYTYPICDGSYYFVKAQAEWQEWDEYDQIFQFNGQSTVGFGGFGFSAGLAR